MACHDGCGFCQVDVRNLTVGKGDDKRLDDVSFSMKCHEITAIIGINGAGKTTLLRCLLGEIDYDGQILHRDCEGENIKINIGYVPQYLDFDRSTPCSVEDFLLSGNVRFPVTFGKRKKDAAKLCDAIEKTSCGGLLKKRLGDLSGGELQRVMLCQALLNSPDLLILDEPISGVDEQGTQQFYELLKNLKNQHIAIALVSHDLAAIKQHADRVILLRKSLLCDGTAAEVYSSEEFKHEFGAL